MKTHPNLNPEPGVWFDGTFGQAYNDARVIRLAYDIDPTFFDSPDDPVWALTRSVLEDGGDADESVWEDFYATAVYAADFLVDYAPEGYWIGWNEGDFGMWEEDDESAPE